MLRWSSSTNHSFAACECGSHRADVCSPVAEVPVESTSIDRRTMSGWCAMGALRIEFCNVAVEPLPPVMAFASEAASITLLELNDVGERPALGALLEVVADVPVDVPVDVLVDVAARRSTGEVIVEAVGAIVERAITRATCSARRSSGLSSMSSKNLGFGEA